ncbi:MAG TPA: hypothetical protein VK452_09980 [Dissulfurispiraceae bacterium]|nr:hypothetical protein [Dissulfurispiraceae bacterium]
MEEMIPPMIQKSTKYTFIIIPILAIIAFYFTDWMFSFNIILGGLISLLSFRAMAWAVRSFLDTHIAQAAIMGISILKILLIFTFLLALQYFFRIIKPVPFLASFTLVLAIIIKEALRVARQASRI